MSDVAQQSILNKSRKDKFILVLNIPDPLKTINVPVGDARKSYNLDLNTLQYSVYGNIVPDVAINPVALNFGGQPMKVTTYQREQYNNVTVNFAVDNGYNNWWVLWKWLDYINHSKMGISNKDGLAAKGPATMHEYQTLITVYGLDEYNNQKIKFDYHKAFITNLQGFKYSYQDATQIESGFTFAFSQLGAELLQ